MKFNQHTHYMQIIIGFRDMEITRLYFLEKHENLKGDIRYLLLLQKLPI